MTLIEKLTELNTECDALRTKLNNVHAHMAQCIGETNEAEYDATMHYTICACVDEVLST